MIHIQECQGVLYFLKKGRFGRERWVLSYPFGSTIESYNAKKYRLDQCIAKFKEKYKI